MISERCTNAAMAKITPMKTTRAQNQGFVPSVTTKQFVAADIPDGNGCAE